MTDDWSKNSCVLELVTGDESKVKSASGNSIDDTSNGISVSGNVTNDSPNVMSVSGNVTDVKLQVLLVSANVADDKVNRDKCFGICVCVTLIQTYGASDNKSSVMSVSGNVADGKLIELFKTVLFGAHPRKQKQMFWLCVSSRKKMGILPTKL